MNMSQLVKGAYQVGDSVANFTLPIHHTGPNLSLYDYTGHIIVLDFFAYWCGPCRTASSELEPYIQQYYEDLGGNPSGIPVKLISINVDCGSPSQTDAYIAQYGPEKVLDDCYANVYYNYGSGSIPQFAIINGAAGTNYNQWELLNNQRGYSSGLYMSFRDVIDSVKFQGNSGSLRVTLIPSQAVNAGAQWNVDGGAWKNSATTVGNLSPGTHTVNYKQIDEGWMTPPSEQVTIETGQTAQLNRVYWRVADINEDGCVDVLDFALLANKWQPIESCREDLDCDGTVYMGDLVFLTDYWLDGAQGGSSVIDDFETGDFSLAAWQNSGNADW